MNDQELVKWARNLYDALYQTEKAGPRAKAMSGVGTGNIPFGPTGIFGLCGSEQEVITAHMTPVGIDSRLPVLPSRFINPLYPTLTGFEESAGTEPSGACADCKSGVMESCYLTATIGRICRETKELEINDLFRRTDRGQFDDLVFLGKVLGDSNFNPVTANTTDWIRVATQAQMVTVGVLIQRVLARMIYQGNPANNVGQGYMEFPGLDMLINTGKQDAQTGIPCPALDSDIKDFNYNDVCAAAPDIVEYLSMMEFQLHNNAEKMGLMPVQWVITMQGGLFHELTACWPCKYLTNRCADSSGNRVGVINDDANVRLRDDMRNGNYLIINGRNYPVIVDDGIFEENSQNSANVLPGEFASDIYFIPLTILGGRPVTYWQHMDYRLSAPDTSFANGKNAWWWSDDGRFMWNMEQVSFCYKFRAKVEPRIVLRTPHLAGRVTNVKYSPLQHVRSPFDDDPYFVKGGEDGRTGTEWYSEWNPFGQ